MSRNKNAFYIEPTSNGDFKATKGGAARASIVTPTQKQAIDAARSIDPGAAIHAARVRHMPGGSPDKFRKIKGE